MASFIGLGLTNNSFPIGKGMGFLPLEKLYY